MALPEFASDPVSLAVLTAVILAVVQYQRTLSWSEYRTIHGLKRRVFPLLQRVKPLGYDHFIHEKGYHDDEEYLTTVEATVPVVWKQLVAAGGSPHLINSLKRRDWVDDEVQYSAAHVVWTHDDGTQTEAYLFGPLFDTERGSPTTAVYAHNETSVTDPDDHLTDPQSDGDPRGVVRGALDA